jgi:hypothetical protein
MNGIETGSIKDDAMNNMIYIKKKLQGEIEVEMFEYKMSEIGYGVFRCLSIDVMVVRRNADGIIAMS